MGLYLPYFIFCSFEGTLSGFGGPYRPFFTIMEYFFQFSVVSVLSAFVSFQKSSHHRFLISCHPVFETLRKESEDAEAAKEN